MRLIYSRRALADLDRIATYYASAASPSVARSIGKRIESVVDQICRTPHAAPTLSKRSGVRVMAVVRYPFRIFYRVQPECVEIVHIRHTSRRPLAST
ncbi:MAG: type II toxin-antitoxin system RelE/ParE family toxin [Bradyrhizobiaceae bacterium]|nr:MAG: type II toxin-antitoxin system RelE/ParE family toxin [Bradyrhizobiaceae bacterium]